MANIRSQELARLLELRCCDPGRDLTATMAARSEGAHEQLPVRSVSSGSRTPRPGNAHAAPAAGAPWCSMAGIG